MSYFKQFFCDIQPEFSVIIDDDDKVCYGYLYRGKKIVGDIWLYNNVQTPEEPEWHTKENLPFLNPLEFVRENLEPFREDTRVEVNWCEDNGIVASIYVVGRIIAKLREGACPGWSKVVSKEGPLAKLM
ncbi:hypothetical protein [Sphingobacterium sp. WOUb80]|uniref:hypothetical protein n=1 Tax=Sphingobacterium sp. WOUb80 TaxID=3234028 RepID=UPI003CF567AC